MRGLLPTVLFVLGLSAFVPQASAQHSGVVLDFSGRGAGAARRAVVGAIDGTIQLERKATVESTARRLGADLSTPDGMARVASELRVGVAAVLLPIAAIVVFFLVLGYAAPLEETLLRHSRFAVALTFAVGIIAPYFFHLATEHRMRMK